MAANITLAQQAAITALGSQGQLLPVTRTILGLNASPSAVLYSSSPSGNFAAAIRQNPRSWLPQLRFLRYADLYGFLAPGKRLTDRQIVTLYLFGCELLLRTWANTAQQRGFVRQQAQLLRLLAYRVNRRMNLSNTQAAFLSACRTGRDAEWQAELMRALEYARMYNA